MQKWKFLQLEPSGLRKPSELDKVGYDTRVSWDGSNLPGTVYRLANDSSTHDYFPDEAALYASLANQLAQLLPDVRSVRVDKDEQRRLLTLEVIDRFGITLPARSLSDGTLRFLALSILSADYTEDSLLFLEEPENGIHPDRIGTIIELLQDMCFDPFDADYDGEPIRQVIVNTHSPGVVAVMPVDSLLFVNQKTSKKGEHTISTASVSVIADTWRAKGARKNKEVSLGQLLYYLDPTMSTNSAHKSASDKRTTQKVGDKFRNQLTLAFSGDE
jgi:predicted ATPase